MGEVKKLCKDNGIIKIELVAHKDAPAINFYKKEDFIETGLLHFEFKI